MIRDIPLRHRIAAAVIAVPCFGVVAAFGIAPATLLEPISVSSSLEELSLPPVTPLAEPNATFTRDERIQRGDTVASLFARLQIEDAAALRRVLGDARRKRCASWCLAELCRRSRMLRAASSVCAI